MTPQEWIEKQRARAEALRSSDVLYKASTSTMAVMSERIWRQGRLTDGSQLTYKEDYELYIYKPPFPKKPNGKGKPFDLWERRGEVATDRAELRSLTRRAQQVGRAKEKQGNKGKQRKIEGQWAPTYLAAKDSQDRKELPFELTGDMRIAWLGSPKEPTPRKVSGLLVQIVMPKKEYDKAKGLEKKKGEFLELTPFEIRHQAETLQRLISELNL